MEPPQVCKQEPVLPQRAGFLLKLRFLLSSSHPSLPTTYFQAECCPALVMQESAHFESSLCWGQTWASMRAGRGGCPPEHCQSPAKDGGLILLEAEIAGHDVSVGLSVVGFEDHVGGGHCECPAVAHKCVLRPPSS